MGSTDSSTSDPVIKNIIPHGVALGFSCGRIAVNGADASAEARRQRRSCLRPDVVLLDLHMPDDHAFQPAFVKSEFQLSGARVAKLDDLAHLPPGPTGLHPWPEMLVRLSRTPVVSIALIRGRATGMGSELALACDMRFASREKAILSQFEVGAGLVPGGGPMARLSRLMGRGRALEVILSANDIPGDLAELYGYVNRSLPDADLDGFVDALATRIASFDKQTIMDTKRLVNVASLPPDIEIESGWNACVASMGRPATQQRIKTLIERGFCKPGDAENRLGDFVGR